MTPIAAVVAIDSGLKIDMQRSLQVQDSSVDNVAKGWSKSLIWENSSGQKLPIANFVMVVH